MATQKFDHDCIKLYRWPIKISARPAKPKALFLTLEAVIRDSVTFSWASRSILFQVKARDQNAQLSGYLLSHTSKTKRWKKKWFMIYNLVMYEFERHEVSPHNVNATQTADSFGSRLYSYAVHLVVIVLSCLVYWYSSLVLHFPFFILYSGIPYSPFFILAYPILHSAISHSPFWHYFDKDLHIGVCWV